MRKFLTKYSAAGTFDMTRLTISATHLLGSDVTNRCTWSGITSIVSMSTPYCCAVAYRTCLSRCSRLRAIGSHRRRTERRYCRTAGTNGSAGNRASRRALPERKTPGRSYPAGGAHSGSRRSWPVRAILLPASALVAVVDALAANFPSIAPFLKGSVVEELVLEKPNLGLVGVQAVFVGEAHKQEYTKSIGLRQTKSEDARICKRRPHSPVT